MDGVGTPIIGRPRPLPGHDTPNPAYHPHTLNYEEPDMVELFNTKKLPQYGMVRLGSRIVFFPYSHLRGRPLGRPTFVIDANSELGELFMRDFDELLKTAERSQ